MHFKLLLTAAGLQNPRVGLELLRLLNKPVTTARTLFIPTAAIWPDALRMLAKCIDELYDVGFSAEQFTIYHLDRFMPLEEMRKFDVVYFAGGSPEHLLRKVTEAAFAPVLEDFLTHGGLYVGTSAGSILAADLGLVNCRFTGIHIHDGSPNGPVDLKSFPDIRLTDNQALLVDSGGAVVFE